LVILIFSAVSLARFWDHGSDMERSNLFTIGHSTRSIEEFLELLVTHHIRHLIDIRTVPRSRHNPQFNRDELLVSLASVSIDYSHVPGLGGFRKASPSSRNTAWRNASFRGYADYMQTLAFRRDLKRCIEFARRGRVVFMCAEAVPWRCHRSLIADALIARGFQPIEIVSNSRVRPHVLTAWARVQGTRVTYPPIREDETLA
jgi:uncharacterized protein (DUF488 family)